MAPSSSARPLGVTILAVLAFVAGILGLLGSLALIGLGGVATSVGAVGAGGLAMIGGLVTLVLSVAEIALGYGFWVLKPAAWRWGAILAIVSLAWAVVSLVVVRFDLVSLIISAVVTFFMLYYLSKANVRQAFKAPATGLPIVGTALDPYFAKINI